MPTTLPRPTFPQTALLPAGARPISAAAGIQEDEQGGVCFLYGWANGCWAPGEDAARRLAALQLIALKAATQREVAAGFGTTPATVRRWGKSYREEGLAGLLRERTGPKGPSKLTPERAQEIRDLRGQGLSQYQIAERVQLSRFKVRRVLSQLPAAPAPAPGCWRRLSRCSPRAGNCPFWVCC